jgi:hypothetical protein
MKAIALTIAALLLAACKTSVPDLQEGSALGGNIAAMTGNITRIAHPHAVTPRLQGRRDTAMQAYIASKAGGGASYGQSPIRKGVSGLGGGGQ